MTRKAYPSDVSDDEWAFVAPYFLGVCSWATKVAEILIPHLLEKLALDRIDGGFLAVSGPVLGRQDQVEGVHR